VLRVTFLGVSTLLFDDGRTALLTDGFFSRPGLLRVAFGRLRPDIARIDAALGRAGITRLAAVLVAHSHYDHALDAPVVAQRTGALLVGSSSTAVIGAGYSLQADRFVPAPVAQPLRLGGFTVTAMQSAHSHPDRFPGTIDEPLTLPARASRYRTGDCYSFHIGHDDGSALVHASANFRPGALAGLRADVVYLGIGQLGRSSEQFRYEYWRQVVEPVQPKRVVPIHWDRFTRPLSRPLQPLPRAVDDQRATMAFLARRCAESDIELVVPTAFVPTHPFAEQARG
jgi:L-ascorbate metabolism protein UlaG (beta-lactamase superfamily)